MAETQHLEGGNSNHLGWGYLPIAEVIRRDAAREPAAFAEQTGGQLRPVYGYVTRTAGQLAVGEAIIEPRLGQLRLVTTHRTGDFVFLDWSDDYGPSKPSGRYQADQRFAVRVPGPTDRVYIQQKVDAAGRHNRVIPAAAARLVAAHLHAGPRSALFRFAINGALANDRVFDELNDIVRFRPVFAEWVHALGRYCLGRFDRGPIAAWQRANPVGAMSKLAAEKGPPASEIASQEREDRTSSTEYVAAQTVQELMDAAFAVGFTAARTAKSSKPRFVDLFRAAADRARSPGFGSPLADGE